ncbi:Gag-Pol protein [Plakobranchus ocellatus]|uniref:Gag-Pol protein n=1 Tax=Plakobranchus ocellatus TaxID=259542 RepID=A0AAV3YG49_9GAST|nr:Gag-Pol protein [Plakobranchus ocellatus]
MSNTDQSALSKCNGTSSDSRNNDKNDKTSPGLVLIKLPERLVLGSNPVQHWKLFKQWWRTYAILSRLQQQDQHMQVAIFLHLLDNDSLKTYYVFHFSIEEDDRTLAEVIEKFDEFVFGEENVTYERFKFN